MAGSINNSFMQIYNTLQLISLGKKPEICIETGTYQGDSSILLTRYFKKVHSIELSKKWYNYAKKRLKDMGSIECHQGDSAVVLPQLIKKISEPVFYYLDAHFAGGDTAFGSKEVPLEEELTAISSRPYQDVIIIDDLRLIGKTGESGSEDNPNYQPMHFDWRDITLEKIAQITGRGLNHVWFFKGDRLVIFRNKNPFQGGVLLFWIFLGTLIDSLLIKPYKRIRYLVKKGKSKRL